MPLPQALEELLRNRRTPFAPDAIHPDAKRYAAQWRLYLDLFELDDEKLKKLLDAHADEDPKKFELRQQLAAVFNYVPTIVRMIVNYIFSEEPTIRADDPALDSFIGDATGAGQSLANFVKSESLPLALLFGFIDTLVQNPATDAGAFLTAADEQAADLTPRALTITPLNRTNWSVRQNHDYIWFRFKDQDADDPDPFAHDPRGGISYVTISSAVDAPDGSPVLDERGNKLGFWMRSWIPTTRPREDARLAEDEARADAPTPPGVAAPGGGTGGNAGAPAGPTMLNGWNHDGGFMPTARVPVATLYYSRSNDPERRHFGLSKVAMIAVLTRKIVQVLSWADEDVLANLALYVFPGPQPTDDKGNPIPVKISPFGIIWLGGDAKIDPKMLQGDTAHIDVKFKLVDLYIREILRLAFIIGASAEAETITSGVQGVVARNELFQELSDLSASLDAYAIDLLWQAAVWADGEDLTREEFLKKHKPQVVFYKGPYAVEPLNIAIQNAQQLIAVFSGISPTMLKSVYSSLATSVLYQDDENRQSVLDEIAAGAEKKNAVSSAATDALLAGVNDAPAAGSPAAATTPGGATPGAPAAPAASPVMAGA
jgi:hypothetical protein